MSANEFSATDIKKMFGIKDQTLKSFDLKARTESKGRGRPTDFYKFKEVLAAWLDWQVRMKSPVVTTPDGDTIDKDLEDAMLTRSKRVAQDLKNEITLGEQAPIEVLSDALAQVSTSINARMTSIPLNLKYANPDIPSNIINHIEREIRAASNEMAGIQLEWAFEKTTDQ